MFTYTCLKKLFISISDKTFRRYKLGGMDRHTDTTAAICSPNFFSSRGEHKNSTGNNRIPIEQIQQNSVTANSKGPEKKLHYNRNSLCKGRNILTFYWRGFEISSL
jgi:hypothetical protein